MEITSSIPDASDLLPSREDEKSLTDPKPWHRLVREKISKEAYRYISPQTYSQIDEFRWNVEKKLVDDSEKLSDRHPEAFVKQILDDDELTMQGLAILAAYIRRTKGLDNIFVCKSLEAFQKKLDEIGRLEGNIRLSMVLTDWPEVQDEHDKKDGEYGADITHKLAVCIEKTGSQVKIVILDPMSAHEDDISPVKVLSTAKDLKYVDIEGVDYLLWYIYHSSLDMKNTSVYFSTIRRQRTYTGCETFAFNDAIAFQRNPRFFDHIRTKKLRITEGEAELKLYKIESLPPAFMRGAQSLRLLKEYVEEREKSQDPETLQNIATLKRKVETHLVEVDGKLQNHSNNQKSIKFHLIAANSLGMISTEELQKIIKETLLTTPRLALANGPQTLSDLHLCKPKISIEEIDEPPLLKA
jgi:hypothetical protein